MANNTTTDFQFTPSVYEIAAMGAGGLALLFTATIFCLLCTILCMVIRVTRALVTTTRSGLRDQTNGR